MRWIGIALALGLAALAFATLLQRGGAPRAPAPPEAIDAASRAKLEKVLRESGAGEATP
jgi:hypothetical protein